MKKLLALVLAMVMTLGLATVSSSAALSDFSDGNDVKYEEAMAVMNAVGVFVGDNGKLAPKDNLTRAQAAKIIAYLNLGGTAAESLSKDVTAFSDVAAGNWAAGYITYCYNAGIIAGDGTGKFNPNDNVTGLQFAKMLLVTLGYEADREGLVGKDYALNTTKLAASNDLFKSNEGLSVNKPATREEAALYAFNALKAPTYAYDTASTTIKGADGLEVLIGGSNAKAVTTGSNRDVITNEDNGGTSDDVLQLGEKLYKGDLVLGGVNGDTDDMGRPSSNWSYKTNKIGNYADKADHTVVIKKVKTVAKVLEDISKKYTTVATSVISLNGDKKDDNDVKINTKLTLQIGDVVEIYMDDDVADQVDYVAVTRYAVKQLTGAPATRTNDGVLQVRLPGVTGTPAKGDNGGTDVKLDTVNLTTWTDAEDVIGYEGLAKDDYVTFYREGNGKYQVAKAAYVEGQLTAVKNDSVKKYTIGGAQYIISAAAIDVGDLKTTPVYNTNYKYFTDANGIIIAADKQEETSKDYVFVETLKYVASNGSIGADDSVEARLVKMDGTVSVVKVAKITLKNGKVYEDIEGNNKSGTVAAAKYLAYDQKADDTYDPALNPALAARTDLYTYSVNSDGEYELKSADLTSGVSTANKATSAATTTYKASTSRLNGVAVNDNTVFVVVNDPTKTSPKFTVYTGKNSAPEFYSASANDLKFTYAMSNSVATYVVVYGYGTKSVSGDWIFIASEQVGTTEFKDADGKTTKYDTYWALKNGASDVELIKVEKGMKLMPGLYESLTFDSTSGALTGGTYSLAKNKGLNTYAPYAGYLMDGTTLNVGKTWTEAGDGDYTQNAFNLPADAIVIYKDTDDDNCFTVGKPADFGTEDGNDLVYVATTNAGDGKVKVLYIMERDVDETGLYAVGTFSSGNPDVLITSDNDTSGTTIIGGKTVSYDAWTISAAKSNADGLNGATAMIVADAGAKIEWNTTGFDGVFATTNSHNATDGDASNLFTLANGSTNATHVQDSATSVYYLKVTAEDNSSVAYYKVSITLAPGT